MPRKYNPGASVNDNYAHICDMCEIDDGRPTLIWNLQNHRYFDLCFLCLRKLALTYPNKENINEWVIIKRQSIPEKLRNEIFKRDGSQCVKCGSKDNLTIDHIIPFSLGGKTEGHNLQTLCKSCNRKKGTNRV